MHRVLTDASTLRPQAAALAELEKVEDLPNNPLDDLVAGLGGPLSVAELTGRSMQLDETNRYVAKGTSKAAHEAERAAFMRGEKLVAIISEAASVVSEWRGRPSRLHTVFVLLVARKGRNRRGVGEET